MRGAIRAACKIHISYVDPSDKRTERTVWPLVIGYLHAVRVLIAWCELRNDFRSFRLDRIAGVTILDDRIPMDPGVLRRRWHATLGLPRTN
ncbi:helix-turn-helix transcriptional regulator [Sphingomonas sp. 7/4-4]|uniref:helix-turn-helix transcriptional regulator n=1 Tax=Sphingomonas sp. 7/4-4 TaxID=3018446 RepID=UPI003FA6D24D